LIQGKRCARLYGKNELCRRGRQSAFTGVSFVSLSRYAESLSRWRLWALALAFCWAALLAISGGPVALAEHALRRHVASAIAVQILGSGALAVVGTELLRGLAFTGGRWSERRHLAVLMALWGVLAVLSVALLILIAGR
jgi:hypothetical protein